MVLLLLLSERCATTSRSSTKSSFNGVCAARFGMRLKVDLPVTPWRLAEDAIAAISAPGETRDMICVGKLNRPHKRIEPGENSPPGGLEPPTFQLGVECAIHCAMEAPSSRNLNYIPASNKLNT